MQLIGTTSHTLSPSLVHWCNTLFVVLGNKANLPVALYDPTLHLTLCVVFENISFCVRYFCIIICDKQLSTSGCPFVRSFVTLSTYLPTNLLTNLPPYLKPYHLSTYNFDVHLYPCLHFDMCCVIAQAWV